MAFNVFISHSTKEPQIVWMLGLLLQQSGVNVYVSEWSPEPGKPLADKITQRIDASDCVLALLTQEGARSPSVNQEIGYAKGRKPIVPLVEKGVNVGVLLQGLEYIPYDSANPTDAVTVAREFIGKLKLQKEGLALTIIGLIGLFVFLWLISRK